MQNKQVGHHPISLSNQRDRVRNDDFGHRPIVTVEVDGIEMGVLDNGTPFLTLRGLANVCGIDHAPLLRLANNWGDEVAKPRGQKILALLHSQGHPGDFLYFRTLGKNGEQINAFPDDVCMAILEYYAFEAERYCTDSARRHYRLLARKSFRDFIYKQCGYDPATAVPALWQPFHDRVSLLHNTVPAGYFGVFHATQDLFVTLGQNGIHSDKSFLPDISVGIAWAIHWKRIKGDEQFGVRVRYDHNYPASYPQSESNPQEPWAYPEMALGEFSRWFRENYIAEGKLETYLKGRSSKKPLPREFVNKVLLAFKPAVNDARISTGGSKSA